MTTWRDESRFNAEGAERFDWLAKWSFGRNFFSDLKRGFSQLGTWQKTVRNGLMITVLVIPCMGTHCCWDDYIPKITCAMSIQIMLQLGGEAFTENCSADCGSSKRSGPGADLKKHENQLLICEYRYMLVYMTRLVSTPVPIFSPFEDLWSSTRSVDHEITVYQMDEILQCLGWPLKDPLMLRCWGGRWCETLWIMYYLSTGDEMNHQPVIFFCRFWENCNGEQRWDSTKHVPAGIGVDGLGVHRRWWTDPQERLRRTEPRHGELWPFSGSWTKNPMFCPRKVGCLERRWSCAWTSDWRKQWSMHKWLLP